MLSVITLSAIMMSPIMLSGIMLNVLIIRAIILHVIILSAIILNVVAPREPTLKCGNRFWHQNFLFFIIFQPIYRPMSLTFIMSSRANPLKLFTASGLYYKTITIVILTIVSDAPNCGITYNHN